LYIVACLIYYTFQKYYYFGIIVVKVQKGNKVVVFNFIAPQGGFGKYKVLIIQNFFAGTSVTLSPALRRGNSIANATILFSY
jgi:hypothetical protein